MEPAEWKDAWGSDRLLLETPGAEGLPAEARKFVRSYGVPKRVIVDCDELPFEISFEPLSGALARLNDVVTWGDFYDAEREREWSESLVIATEDFANGSALYCVRWASGDIRRVDVELEEPETFVSSSVEQFARSLLLAAQSPSLTEIEAAVAQLDPQAVASPEHFWPSLIERASSQGAGTLTITTDPARSRRRF